MFTDEMIVCVCVFFVSYRYFMFIISDGLFQSTQNRKFLGFQLVRKILPQISARQVPIVFSAHMMRSLINGLSSPKNYLHEAAKQLVCLADQPSPIFFVPCGTYNCEACTEALHLSQLAATVFQTASFLDCHPASTLSFSTVCLHVVFGFLRLLFLSGAQVTVMLQSLFWSCLSILSNHLQSLLLQLFTKRFHVCSF